MAEIPLYHQLMLPVVTFFVALACRAVFSFLETSLTALRLFKLKEMSKSITRYRFLFHTLEKNPQRVLMTILIANSISDVLLAAIATNITEVVFSRFNFSGNIGFSIGIGIASIAIILFGDIIPKNFARRRGEHLFPSLLWLINGVFYLFYPLVAILMSFTERIMYTLEGPEALTSTDWVASEQEIRFLIDYIHEKGLLELEKTEMLQNIFELGDTPVKEIMVPSNDIISVNIDRTAQEVLEIFYKHRFTRLPVYKDRSDNIIGMIHQKDVFVLLMKQNIKVLKEIVRPIMFVPETLKINQLLRQFRRQHMHIAIVLNEHGIVTGLITLEDILEEIVGEITDEHESVSSKAIKMKDGSLQVDGSISLEDLEELLKIKFTTQNSVTLGGFLTEMLQHLPKKGEKLAYANHVFTVQRMTNRRVHSVTISKQQEKK